MQSRMLALALLLGSSVAHAGVVQGGSALVGSGSLAQLEAWLGQGELTLTNVFTKTTGSTATDFHLAADDKGATFTVLSASEDNGNTWYTVGGYNPVSWHGSANTYTSDGLFDAFLFNLTTGKKFAQSNSIQAASIIGYGPTFGGGHDLYVNNELSLGYSYGYSYLGGNGNYTLSIVDGSMYDGTNIRIGALEVFAISDYVPPADVPEPTALGLLAIGLGGLAAMRRRGRTV